MALITIAKYEMQRCLVRLLTDDVSPTKGAMLLRADDQLDHDVRHSLLFDIGQRRPVKVGMKVLAMSENPRRQCNR